MKKHVSILVPDGAAVLGCIEGALKTFRIANLFLEGRGGRPLFDIQLVALTKEPRTYDGYFSVQPDATVRSVQRTDLIIVPPVNGDMHEVVELNNAFFSWIRERYAEGAEVASLCVGAFLLAGTGLLEGKRCSTHWSADHLFRTMYPGVTLVSDKVITDEEGVYSSGGANSFWNLLLYLVEKYVDRAMAVHIAKYYEIEIDRVSQASYFMFKGQKEHDDAPVRKVQEYIETNYQERLTVADLASMAALSRRNLERRFKKATSNTVVEYIQRVKVEAAKLRLESSGENVNEVMERVGYADSKAFRTTFRKITGLSPLEYRAKYRRPESYGVSM
ncbi:MAG: helix-turn-helix domain-containing protein [Bacteroidetes bacterium]|nr:MAG: helix-turn-helix domain-containing protein [Bacteroidota bacterium]